MTAITILAQDASAPDERRFRAAAGDRRAEGRTIGEALDALLAQWGDAEGSAVDAARVVLSRFGPDVYFTQAQHDRQRELMARHHDLSPTERAELESLVDAELDATVARLDGLPRP